MLFAVYCSAAAAVPLVFYVYIVVETTLVRLVPGVECSFVVGCCTLVWPVPGVEYSLLYVIRWVGTF